MTRNATPAQPPVAAPPAPPAPAAAAAEHERAHAALVAEDLLVEDLSIDGMCGVY